MSVAFVGHFEISVISLVENFTRVLLTAVLLFACGVLFLLWGHRKSQIRDKRFQKGWKYDFKWYTFVLWGLALVFFLMATFFFNHA